MPGLTTVRTVWTIGSESVPGGPAPLNAAIASAAPIASADPTPGDLYGIFYTGGTTAASKGVMLSHGNIVANAMNMLTEVHFNAETVYLHAAPMFHLADCASTFTVTMVGGTHTFVPRFDPATVMRIIQERRVTHSILVPAMIAAIVNAPAIGDYDLVVADHAALRRPVDLGGGAPPRARVPARLRLRPGVRDDRAVPGGDIPVGATSQDRRRARRAAARRRTVGADCRDPDCR